MDTSHILNTVKDSIANITGISADTIEDTSAYVEDLKLDSLSILEVVVEIEYQFKIKIPEERLGRIRTVDDTVQAVQEHL
ncbi:MAG: acyl carrier protein [Blastocatellia bacterium]